MKVRPILILYIHFGTKSIFFKVTSGKPDLKNKTTHTRTHTQGRERNEERKKGKERKRKEREEKKKEKKRDPV